jgi:META domain
MPCLRRRSACWLVWAVLASSILPAAAAGESSFPFGSELMLDASPLPGSKRVPMIEIEENGAASIDLWCASVPAAAMVGDDTIVIVPGAIGAAQCTPEQQSRDADLLAALSQATGWRRDGDIIELLGATTLRFYLMTN